VSILSDVRYAARALRRAPLFTGIVVFTLALGIGANAVVFTVVNAILIRKLPYADPDRLVALHFRARDGARADSSVPSPVFEAWRAQSHSLAGAAAYAMGNLQIASPSGEPTTVSAAFISPNMFDVLGVAGIEMGRPFAPDDAISNAPQVAIVSQSFWRDRLGARDDLTRLSLPGSRRLVVGVMSESFQFPDVTTPDVLVPLIVPGGDVVSSFNVLARLSPAATLPAVESDLAEITRLAAPSFPSAMAPRLAQGGAPSAVTLQRQLAGDLRPVLFVAFGVAGAVLLIACANVAGLLLARMTNRRRELAIRAALGGTSAQLARLVLTESGILALAGGAAALLTVWWSLATLRHSLVGAVPHAGLIAMDGRVAAFVLAAGLLSGTLGAAIPVAQLLLRGRENGRSGAAPVLRFGSRHLIQRALVVGQMSGAMVLLVLALLLLNTLWRISDAADIGFNPRNVLTFRVPGWIGTWGRPRETALDEIVNRIRTLPGVVSAGATTSFPLDGHGFKFTIPVEGQPEPTVAERDNTGVDVVSPGYFRTMGITLRAGREFKPNDDATAPRIAIVNEAFLRWKKLSDLEAVGRRIGMGGGLQYANIEIVGVVEDVKDQNPGDEVKPIVYRPFMQAAPNISWGTADIVVRTTTDPIGLSEPVRQVIGAVVPGAAPNDVQSMEHRIAILISPQRQRAVVFGVFGFTAVLLAAVGLYGLLTYVISQEMREFGIRLAIGARREQLMWLVLRRGVLAALVGLAFGVAGARLLTSVLAGMLYGVTATDLLTFAVAAAVMLAVAIVASYVPARRAMRADPLEVLRAE
jgi:putative ABC transport system permease protein